jgi:hypothetical protein
MNNMNSLVRAKFPQRLDTPDGAQAFSRWLKEVSTFYQPTEVHLVKLRGQAICVARNYEGDKRMTWSPDEDFVLHYGWFGVTKSRKPTVEEVLQFKKDVAAEMTNNPAVAYYVQKAAMPVTISLQEVSAVLRQTVGCFEQKAEVKVDELADRFHDLFGKPNDLFFEIDNAAFPLFQLQQLADLIDGTRTGSMAHRHFGADDYDSMGGICSGEGSHRVTNQEGVLAVLTKLTAQLRESITTLETKAGNAANAQEITRLLSMEHEVLDKLDRLVN